MCVAGDFSLDKDPTNHQRSVTEAKGNGGEEGVTRRMEEQILKEEKKNGSRIQLSSISYSQIDRESRPCVC